MNEDIVKRRLILDLAIKDLLKVMGIIDGIDFKNDNRISSFNEIQYLDYETNLINSVRDRLEAIFREQLKAIITIAFLALFFI